ncbi:bacterial Ig-like domain-containing protein, partial [Enterococcus faecalis]|uniref:bacterial Ig-like domain-containing protein n=1 Tax=Enterococcus faecalis TaxID=1351 RepID=UPI003CC5F47E
MKIIKYICVYLLLCQIFVTPVLSYAEEINQSTMNNITEDSKVSPLTDRESTSDQLREIDGEETTEITVRNENSGENATNQSEDNATVGNLFQESSDIESSMLNQQAVPETRGVISSMWGTSPVTFDEETGELTVDAGEIRQSGSNSTIDNDKKIHKDDIKEIIFRETVEFPSDSSDLLGTMYNLKKISGSVDTSGVTSMSGLFRSSSNIIDLGIIEDWDTSNVVDFSAMFYDLNKIENLNLSKWDTSSAKSMFGMFQYMSSLKSLDVSNFNTSNVRNFNGTFIGLSSLEILDLSSFDTSSATDFSNFFYNTKNLKTLILDRNSILNKSVNLSAINTSTGEYTGAWERITPSNPEVIYSDSNTFVTEYDGTLPGTYTWQKSKQTLIVKDSTLYVGDSWTSASNFVSATNKEGTALTVSDIEVEGTVDTKTAGVYEVTYKNGSLSETAKVTVKENKATLKVEDSTLYVGDNWTSTDNFVSATDKEGTALTVSDLEVKGTVDTSTAGNYKVTYMNGSLSEIATISVKKRVVNTRPDIIVGSIYDNIPLTTTFYGYLGNIGTSFPDRDTYPEFHTGSNREGFKVPNDLVTTYTLKNGTKFIELPTIRTPKLYKGGLNEVLLDTGIVSYSTDGLTFTDNPPTNPEEIKSIRFMWLKGGIVTYPKGRFVTEQISGKIAVDFSKVSEDELIVMENDSTGTSVSSGGTVFESKRTNYVVNIKENKATLKVKDSTLYVGDNWALADNFVSATDKEGTALTVSDLEIEGTVDTKTAGVYEVTYKNGSLSETVKVTVKENK